MGCAVMGCVVIVQSILGDLWGLCRVGAARLMLLLLLPSLPLLSSASPHKIPSWLNACAEENWCYGLCTLPFLVLQLTVQWLWQVLPLPLNLLVTDRDFLCGVISVAGDGASVCFLVTWTGIWHKFWADLMLVLSWTLHKVKEAGKQIELSLACK